MLAIALALAAAVPRALGGAAVLRQRDRLHLAMGFAGGALLGVATFETLPAALGLAPDFAVVGLVAGGAATFAALERSVFGHVHSGDAACRSQASSFAASGITAHALLDGLAIGTAFRADAGLGMLVSAAVLLHAFADGVNTVTIVLRGGSGRRRAVRWLAADVGAPVFGAALALVTTLPGAVLGLLLAFFAGMFLSIGAGGLLPEAHRLPRDRLLMLGAAAAGLTLAIAASQLA